MVDFTTLASHPNPTKVTSSTNIPIWQQMRVQQNRTHLDDLQTIQKMERLGIRERVQLGRMDFASLDHPVHHFDQFPPREMPLGCETGVSRPCNANGQRHQPGYNVQHQTTSLLGSVANCTVKSGPSCWKHPPVMDVAESSEVFSIALYQPRPSVRRNSSNHSK
jgi:hypothetical protein